MNYYGLTGQTCEFQYFKGKTQIHKEENLKVNENYRKEYKYNHLNMIIKRIQDPIMSISLSLSLSHSTLMLWVFDL